MKKTALVLIVLLAVLGSSVTAESPKQQAAEKKEVIQSKKELEATKHSLDQLSSLVDRWHEANLDGNEKNIRRYEQAIINLLIKDINATFRWVDRVEHEKGRARVQARVGDERDLAGTRIILSKKQVLLHKLKKSDCFSFRYRLLSDYRDLLRRELKMNRIELAENVKDVRSDGK
ncbi:MAG: hypothetical protein JSU74_12295 [Candidatus Zixiibacteriota bacterium]|nr:MAG: hypothetical protein JSU74_12295 [candidate division Zixibacteria bacterium]